MGGKEQEGRIEKGGRWARNGGFIVALIAGLAESSGWFAGGVLVGVGGELVRGHRESKRKQVYP